MDGREAVNRKDEVFRLDKVVAGVAVLALAVSIVFVLREEPPKWFNNLQSFQAVLQFFAVTVLGGVIALWYRQVEDRRVRRQENTEKAQEAREAKRTILENFYRSLIELHDDCKKVRRTLRAFSYDKEGKRACKRSDFRRLMDKLEDVQLRAETKREDVKIQVAIYGPKQAFIIRDLSRIENYLNNLLDHYETMGAINSEQEDREIILSEDLQDFIRPRRESKTANEGYFEPTNRIRDAIIELIKNTFPEGLIFGELGPADRSPEPGERSAKNPSPPRNRRSGGNGR
jgi:hypothetical protein